jgi:hypothetical protein
VNLKLFAPPFPGRGGALSDSSEAGQNIVSIKRSLAGRRLAAGRYRLVVKATDAAGNVSPAERTAFRIKR